MDNMASLFKNMNMDQFIPKGGKFNNNAFQNMMDQNVKMSKMKERMRKKLSKIKIIHHPMKLNIVKIMKILKILILIIIVII